tara:strand:- start:20 stop:301 length:282 start_codon:yes stop_codon:yes gene_type:complete
MSKENKKVDFDNLKTINVKKSNGKFKVFTNASIIPDAKDFQPYLGKHLVININKIMSIYPSEDGIGTMIHSEHNYQTWKVLEDIETVVDRVNE